MKWLLVIASVFLVSILILFYEVRSLDRKYSTLITQGTTQLGLVQRISFNSNRRHMLFYQSVHGPDSLERRRLLGELDSLGRKNTELFDSLVLTNADFPDHLKIIEKAKMARKKYGDQEMTYLNLIRHAEQKIAQTDLDRELDNNFLVYQRHINDLFHFKNKDVVDFSDQFTEETKLNSAAVLVFSALPFAVLAILVVFVVILLRQVVYHFNSN